MTEIKIESHHEIQVNCDTLDETRTVANFDLYDKENDEVVAHGGYLQIDKGSESFVVTMFNTDGDVCYTVALPFNFKVF